MRIRVDFDLCESNAVCVGMAPDVFELDENDYLQVLREDVADDRLDEMRQVAANCPKAAIALD